MGGGRGGGGGELLIKYRLGYGNHQKAAARQSVSDNSETKEERWAHRGRVTNRRPTGYHHTDIRGQPDGFCVLNGCD